MRVLVATADGQGRRKSDFCWTEEGELVKPVFECDGETVDGGCGCRRCMAGLKSHRSTTTFRVAEMEVNLLEEVAQGLVVEGWAKEPDYVWAAELVRDIARVAAAYPVGTLLEKRGNKIQERKL